MDVGYLKSASNIHNQRSHQWQQIRLERASRKEEWSMGRGWSMRVESMGTQQLRQVLHNQPGRV